MIPLRSVPPRGEEEAKLRAFLAVLQWPGAQVEKLAFFDNQDYYARPGWRREFAQDNLSCCERARHTVQLCTG